MSRDKKIGVKDLLGYKLKRTQHALRLCMDKEFRMLDLTTPQYSVLAQLELHPGISNAALARSAFITAQTMHVIVLNLEKRGLIEREKDPEHGRILRAKLTEQGRKIVAAAHDLIQRCEDKMVASMTPENKRLFELMLLECFKNLNDEI